MEFQDMPDEISEALAALRAAFPRFKLEEATVAVYRQHLRPFSGGLVKLAVNRIVAGGKRFPTIAELVAECRQQANSSPTGEACSALHPTPEEHERLTPRERWIRAHALAVVWAADHERRGMHRPPGLDELHLNAEMVAHGVEIDHTGTRVKYDRARLLEPVGCPCAMPRFDDTRDSRLIQLDARAAFESRMESLLERNAIRREEVA